MFITFEGIEGSGKSTLLTAIAEKLRSAGKSVVTTREPGGTRVGDAIRAVFLQPDLSMNPMTEALLVNASRAALTEEVIRPALARGTIVLCDRYTDSTLAYQGYGRGLDLSVLRQLCDAATGGLKPDVTFLLDLSPEQSQQRLAGRDGQRNDRIENESIAFHALVRHGFLMLAKEDVRMRALDALQSPEKLLARAMQVLAEKAIL